MQSFFRTKKTEDDKQEIVEEALLANYDSSYRLAYAYVKNPEDAGDIVQEGRSLRGCSASLPDSPLPPGIGP